MTRLAKPIYRVVEAMFLTSVLLGVVMVINPDLIPGEIVVSLPLGVGIAYGLYHRGEEWDYP